MRNYLKTEYLLFLFLLVNITAEHIILSSVSKIVFYCVLALSVPFVIVKAEDVKKGFSTCPYLLVWIVIYIAYQFTLGYHTINHQNLIYLVAKIATFCMVSMSITENLDFYLKTMSKPMGYIIVFLLIIGFNEIDFTGSKGFGFYNTNAACAISVIGATCFLFEEKKMTTIDIICLSVCIISCLMGGSRNSLAMLVIIVLFRYGFSTKLLIFIVFSAMLIFFVLPYFGIEFRGIERVIGTFNGTVDLDREDQRKAAEWMIEQHPWDGNGFYFSNYGKALDFTQYSSHNGYLETIANMGYFFGSLWLIIFAIAVIHTLFLYKEHNIYINKYLGILLSIVFATINEGFLTGVNQFITNMFFVSLMVLSTYRYRKSNKLQPMYESDILR